MKSFFREKNREVKKKNKPKFNAKYVTPRILNNLGLSPLIYEMRIVVSAFLTLQSVVKIK